MDCGGMDATLELKQGKAQTYHPVEGGNYTSWHDPKRCHSLSRGQRRSAMLNMPSWQPEPHTHLSSTQSPAQSPYTPEAAAAAAAAFIRCCMGRATSQALTLTSSSTAGTAGRHLGKPAQLLTDLNNRHCRSRCGSHIYCLLSECLLSSFPVSQCVFQPVTVSPPVLLRYPSAGGG
jgi:hypothetical protein